MGCGLCITNSFFCGTESTPLFLAFVFCPATLSCSIVLSISPFLSTSLRGNNGALEYFPCRPSRRVVRGDNGWGVDSVSQILEWDKVDTSFFLLLSSVQPLFLALSSCLFLLFLPTSHFFYLLRVRGILLRGGGGILMAIPHLCVLWDLKILSGSLAI